MLHDRGRSARLAAGLLLTMLLTTAACTAAASPSPSPAPSPAGGGMNVVAKGDFHRVDGEATGVGEIATLADGSYEVILDQFSIGSNAHTNVVLVSNADVARTTDVDPSKMLDLGALKATSGMQTYPIPSEMAASVMDGYHTVVIWDTEMAHAIAAAPLR
ncbi:MAG TPA: DM13 domain-containing protein [Candidatus Limnocylindrales bacterium]